MKLFRILLVLAFAFVLLMAGQGQASAFAFSYTSGVQVQNLSGSATANITVTYYNKDGTVNTAPNDTIPAAGSKTYYPIAPAAGFNGSAVVSSDQPVAAVVNVLGNSGAAGASYVGSTTGATPISLPLLMKGNSGYNTWFNVQNAGSADASVTATYSDGTTKGPVTIKPGAAATFDQSTETHSAAVFSGSVASAGGQPLVVAVIEENPKTMFAYSGFAGGSTGPIMPLINANNSGYITGVQIQNTGGSSTNVTVSYKPSSAGTACTETQPIAAGKSATFALGAFAGSVPAGGSSTCVAGAKFIGSAQVTANSASQNLVAIVNQLKPGVNGEAYGAFSPANATNKVVMPLIMDRRGGYFTGFSVMNVGSAAATITCTFSGTSYTVSASVAAGSALADLQNGKIAVNYAGSGTCSAPGAGDKIVAVVNELGPSGTADQLLVYEGINQ